MLVAVLLALVARLASLDASGFSEDEVAKLRAIEAYRQGQFSANAEHPMLLKLSIWATLAAADVWNRTGAGPAVSAETAVRLPNALAGTATVAAIYGAVALLSGPAVGLAAAFIVALDPNVTALNRIGKEDSFLLFFLFTAIACYEKGKQVGAVDPIRAQRWYTASGAGFGLMLASKYMPHLFGLYALFNVVAMPDAGANKPRKSTYYGAMVLAFLASNLAILLPSTWVYIADYIRGGTTMHHGHLYDGALYTNTGTTALTGLPITYYLRLIATKVPLVTLLAAIAALAPLLARRRERGFIWMRIFLVVPLVGYSLMASKFQRYALPMLVVVDIMAAVSMAMVLTWLGRRVSWPPAVRAAAAGAAGVALAGWLSVQQWESAPYYSLHQNVVGAREPAAAVFPEESYDYGVREAVEAIAVAAAPGAAIVSDASLVVRYYVERAGRADLAVRTLSEDGLTGHGEQWVIVQDAHIYFENQQLVTQLRRETPWREYRLRGTSVLQVFRLPV